MGDESGWVAREYARIARRREALGVAPPEVGRDGTHRAWGLALSGGGLRSATFSLGVMQALANEQVAGAAGRPTAWLRFFDYLSTVSAGGYIGAFFTSLFLPNRLLGGSHSQTTDVRECREAAEVAYKVMGSDPPGRIRAREPWDRRRGPLAWLRVNGRNLRPMAGGDFPYAPLDVRQYKHAAPGFPHQRSTERSLDEAQWESYRRLGLLIGTLVFGGENGIKLIERLNQEY